MNFLCCSPGLVPEKFKLSSHEVDLVEGSEDPKSALEQLAVSKDLPVFMRSIQGEVRYKISLSKT